MQPQKRGPGYTSILSLLPCMVVLSGCAETQSSQTTSLGTAGTVGSAGSSGESSGGVGTGGSLGANAGGGLVGGGSGTGGEPGLSGSAGTSGTAGMGASGGLGGIGGIGNTAGQSGAAGTGTGGTGQSSLTASVLESGAIHSCAITSAGSPMCWGGNAWGELGDNSTTQGHIPVTVAGLISGASAISAGEYHTCVVTNSGGAMCWGGNDHGQLGEGSTTTSLVPVAVAGLSSGVTAISAGEKHTCAVTSSGGAMCWGGNVYSQLGDNSSADSLVPVAVADLSSGVTAISAGSFHTCVVLNTGGAMCWGGNYFGQLGDSSNTDRYAPVQVVGLSSGVKAISAGAGHTCAVTSTGGVMCWGSNDHGQLGNDDVADSLVPVAVAGLSSGVTAISAGENHTCAVTNSGGALCWGANYFGQLGDASTTERHVPVEVVGLSSGITAISAGQVHTCALTSTGGVMCWGDNAAGQLGDGSGAYSLVPVGVSGFLRASWRVSPQTRSCRVFMGGSNKCNSWLLWAISSVRRSRSGDGVACGFVAWIVTALHRIVAVPVGPFRGFSTNTCVIPLFLLFKWGEPAGAMGHNARRRSEKRRQTTRTLGWVGVGTQDGRPGQRGRTQTRARNRRGATKITSTNLSGMPLPRRRCETAPVIRLAVQPDVGTR